MSKEDELNTATTSTPLPTGVKEPSEEEPTFLMTTGLPQTTKIGRLKRRKLSRRKKKKLLRPNSPAAYPSALPIRNEYYEQQQQQQQQAQITGLSSNEKVDDDVKKQVDTPKLDNSLDAFQSFRVHYLIIHIAIMLADGLQGKELTLIWIIYVATRQVCVSNVFLSFLCQVHIYMSFMKDTDIQ